MLGMRRDQGLVRKTLLHIGWSTFGSPTQRAVLKLLRKFFAPNEARYLLNRANYGEFYFKNRHEAMIFAKRFKKLFHRSVRTGIGHRVYDREISDHTLFLPEAPSPGRWHLGSYWDLDQLDWCSACEVINPPFFESHDGCICRRCARPLIKFDDLPPKEVKRNVQTFLRNRGQQGDPARGSDTDVDEIDDEFDLDEVG